MTAHQRGLSEAADSTNGRRTVRYYGSVAIVRCPYCVGLSQTLIASVFQRDRERVYFGMWFCDHLNDRRLIVLISSAIIEDIKDMRESRSALVVYYYFDFKDAAKRDVRGFLASFLSQLVHDSDQCWNVLSQLHNMCRDGSDLPSEAALTQCLKSMLDLPGQDPVYLIVDALDESPNNTGTPSPREKVLNVMEDLVRLDYPHLFICITSRPEQDVISVLDPLISASCRVSLHEEGGQREDINNYVRFFVQNDRAMRRWREEDKELVINGIGQVSMGVLPAGQPTSMHAIKYSEGPERITCHFG